MPVARRAAASRACRRAVWAVRAAATTLGDPVGGQRSTGAAKPAMTPAATSFDVAARAGRRLEAGAADAQLVEREQAFVDALEVTETR